MYEGIRKATGPATKKCSFKWKTGAVITDRKKQMRRWVEHHLDLYSMENKVSEEALDSIQALAIASRPGTECRANLWQTWKDNALASAKAAGNDAIPLKLSNKGNQHYFHISISNAILLQGRRVPQNMRDAKIVTLFKNKVDWSDCNNCRGISLNYSLQRLINNFFKANDIGLKISIRKTEVMRQDIPIPPSISLNGTSLTFVDKFKYMGS